MDGGHLELTLAVGEFTVILGRVQQGEAKAAEELLPLVYQELRGLAARKMAAEKAGQTLQPTALVHEAWLRLAGGAEASFENRAHFFGAAAEAMRRILIERARRHLAIKRGGGVEAIPLDGVEILGEPLVLRLVLAGVKAARHGQLGIARDRQAELWQQAIQALARCEEKLSSPALERMKPQLNQTANAVANSLTEARVALARISSEFQKQSSVDARP